MYMCLCEHICGFVCMNVFRKNICNSIEILNEEESILQQMMVLCGNFFLVSILPKTFQLLDSLGVVKVPCESRMLACDFKEEIKERNSRGAPTVFCSCW